MELYYVLKDKSNHLLDLIFFSAWYLCMNCTKLCSFEVHTHLLASSEAISQVLFTSEQPKKIKTAFFGTLSLVSKFTLLATSYSACVVYSKTIIHLSVGKSSGYLPPLQ